MGVFTRFRDIISSNMNAMLDRAEDPEKLIRLMIQEMEDTLVEIRASCANAMASKKKLSRAHEDALKQADEWETRARLAVDKGREDLAREALSEKHRRQERTLALEGEASQCDTLIEQYQADIIQLEEKLGAAREKQRLLVQRHIHANHKKRAQNDIKRAETSDAFMRFEQFENRIERMEAEADLVNFGRKMPLEQEIETLRGNDRIEQELEALKNSKAGKKDEGPSA